MALRMPFRDTREGINNTKSATGISQWPSLLAPVTADKMNGRFDLLAQFCAFEEQANPFAQLFQLLQMGLIRQAHGVENLTLVNVERQAGLAWEVKHDCFVVIIARVIDITLEFLGEFVSHLLCVEFIVFDVYACGLGVGGENIIHGVGVSDDRSDVAIYHYSLLVGWLMGGGDTTSSRNNTCRCRGHGR